MRYKEIYITYENLLTIIDHEKGQEFGKIRKFGNYCIIYWGNNKID